MNRAINKWTFKIHYWQMTHVYIFILFICLYQEINDSDESSFGFYGKEQATEVSYWFGIGENLI